MKELDKRDEQSFKAVSWSEVQAGDVVYLKGQREGGTFYAYGPHAVKDPKKKVLISGTPRVAGKAFTHHSEDLLQLAIEWKTLTTRVDDPKLSQLENKLDEAGIPHRRRGHSLHAPILEVECSRWTHAWALMDLEDREIDDAVVLR